MASCAAVRFQDGRRLVSEVAMHVRLIDISLAMSLVLGSGCQFSAAQKPAYPPDPLLASKEPAASNPPSTPQPLYAAAVPDPQPPRFPVSPSPEPSALAREGSGKQVVAQPVSRRHGPFEAIPAVRVPTHSSQWWYYHAADFSVLHGVLEKQWQGDFLLRYANGTEAAEWGGKVALEPDPRLAQFGDGDWVRVEGKLLPSLLPANKRNWDWQPRYRIQNMHMLEGVKQSPH